MKTPTFLLTVVAVSALLGCRDEQAGPKTRSSVRASSRMPEQLTFHSGGTWAGGAVRYLGTRLEPATPQPNQPLELKHYFQTLRPPPQGYRFFVHVIDPTTGQMMFNADHEPQNGAAPLSAWPVGQVVEDSHVIQWPAGAGQARLVLGFWREGERLPVDQPNAHDGANRMLGPSLGAQPLQLPSHRATRVQKAPTIDGRLDDAAWANAKPLTLVQSFDGRPATLATTARIVYDDTHLYVAFDSVDPDVWGTKRKHDDDIYNEEVVEVFLDADGDGRTYNELQVSPHNVTFDASFVSHRSDLATAMKWESGMRTAVQVRGTLDDASDRDEGWSAEMAIPFASLTAVPNVPPKSGDRWRFNLYRLEHHERLRRIEGQAFSPLFKGDFHHLPMFGWLEFE